MKIEKTLGREQSDHAFEVHNDLPTAAAVLRRALEKTMDENKQLRDSLNKQSPVDGTDNRAETLKKDRSGVALGLSIAALILSVLITVLHLLRF